MALLDEQKRRLKLQIAKTKVWFSTQYRKLQIRHAYHPMRIAMPILFFAFTIAISLILLFFAGREVYTKFQEKQTQTVVQDSIAADTLTSADEIEHTGEYFLAPFPALPGQEDMEHIIVADKYDRVLHLLKCQRGIWGVIKSYPIAIGEKEGRKQLSGDKKTPEGTYIIIDKYFPKDIEKKYNASAEIYGPLAYVLNYPNFEDSLAGRTGNGIWIHGTVEGKVPVDTKGCLEMHNNNIKKLEQFLGNGDLTPVVIHRNPTFNLERDIDLRKLWQERERVIASRLPLESITTAIVKTDSVITDSAIVIASANKPFKDTVKNKSAEYTDTIQQVTDTLHTVLTISDTIEETTFTASASSDSSITTTATSNLKKSDSLMVINRIHTWKKDWESADIARYQNNYDTLYFSSGSFDWPKWRAKKVRTFKNYDTIEISISELKIQKLTAKRAEVLFFQKYRSDLFRAENGKKIILQKRDGNWKIVQELTVRY